MMLKFTLLFIPYLLLAQAAPIIQRQSNDTLIATSTFSLTSPTTTSISSTTTVTSSITTATNTIPPIPLAQAFNATSFDPDSIPPPDTTVSPSPTSADSSLPTSNVNSAIFDALRRSAEFTNAAYCSSDSVKDWQCGVTCDALGNITVLATGGDNKLTPDYYIAYDPTIQSIVVSQQGTDPREILSLAVDADFLQSPINTTYFPTAPNNTLVHAGFQDAFLRTVEDVKTQVTNGLQAYNVSNVLVTGHSLGAAIGVMNGVFLKGLFGDQVNVTTHVFGLPRAGNSIWADFVDSTLNNTLLHMHLAHDPIPTIPPRGILDYTHPSGEVFDPLIPVNNGTSSSSNGGTFLDGSTAVFCPGRENENCSAGNSLFTDNIEDHLGPYLTVDISSFACPN